MKLPFLLLALASVVTAPLHAQVSPVRMTVELSNKTTSPPKEPHDKTQTRSLKITLYNNSAEAFDGLAVKYWFVGHPAGSNDSKVMTQGERKSSLAARSKDIVDSEVATSHYVEAHNQAAKGGKGGGGGKSNKVPASGDKITGYAVRVLKDDKILAEYYSEPSVKATIK
jgi:hypothetical protein